MKVLKGLMWIAPIAVVVVVFAAFYLHVPQPEAGKLEQTGQFGDSFGSLNALFTGLGFGGLVVTLNLQQKQISNQEAEAREQRQTDAHLRYEDTLFRLLALYKETLGDVSSPSHERKGRSLLRGTVDSALAALRKEGVTNIPDEIRERLDKGSETQEDREVLDYLFFRNFKILSVEVDRQGRLTNTLVLLLRHLVENAPASTPTRQYSGIVISQLTHVEATYFFLVALTFNDQSELRGLIAKSRLLEMIAHVKRYRIHDLMYKQFWGETISDYKVATHLPISDTRINRGIAAYKRLRGPGAARALKIYASPRVTLPPNGEPS